MSTIKATNFQHASAANPAIVLAADGSATANVSSINNGPLAGFRNAIINGNFDIWQRGTSLNNPISTAYLADRWTHGFNGSGSTRTISRGSFALGQTDVPGEPAYFFRYNQSVGGTGTTGSNFQQRIESVRTFAGQQVTVSFYAKAASAITLSDIYLNQNFGSGGSPSSIVITTLVANLAIGTTWTKHSYTTTLPSISGKTVGSNADDSLSLVFNLPLNAIFTLDIAQVQVEPGPVATPFERRPIGTELALCQRYFQIGNFKTNGYYLSAYGTQGMFGFISFTTYLRANPTVTLISSSMSTSNINSGTLAVDYASGLGFMMQGAPTANAPTTAAGVFSASAEL